MKELLMEVVAELEPEWQGLFQDRVARFVM